MKTTSVTPPGRRSEITIGPAVAVEKNPEERPLLLQGLLLHPHHDHDLRSSEWWTQRINCVDPNEVRTGKTVELVGVTGRNLRGSNPPLLRPTKTTSTPTPASSGTLRIWTTPVNPMGPSGKYFVSTIIRIKSEQNTRSRPPLAGIRSRQPLNQGQGPWTQLGPSNEGPRSVMPRPPHLEGVLGHPTFPIGDLVHMRSSMTGRGDPIPRPPVRPSVANKGP